MSIESMSSRIERALGTIKDESIRSAIASLFEEAPASFAPPTAAEANERIRLAVIKLASDGPRYFDIAANLYKTDARDLLMSAGFGTSLDAHKHWYEEVTGSSYA